MNINMGLTSYYPMDSAIRLSYNRPLIFTVSIRTKLQYLFTSQLSIDDFAANRGQRMKHLKEILHSSPTSIVLPSVSLKQDFDYDKKSNKLVEYLEKTSHGAIIPLTAQGWFLYLL